MDELVSGSFFGRLVLDDLVHGQVQEQGDGEVISAGEGRRIKDEG